jgi:prevent-host-death family protein
MMPETTVGVRKLKEHLSEYLRRVKTGETIVITDHGQPVGRLVPVDQPLEAKLQAMIEAGSLAWSGQKLEPMVPVARVAGEGSVADLLVEDRG